MARLAVLAVFVVGVVGVAGLATPAYADAPTPGAGSAGSASGSDGDGADGGAQAKLIPGGSGKSTANRSTGVEPVQDLTSHKGQLGLSARFALIGISAIKPYNSGDYCGATSDGGDAAVCINRLPVSLDLEPSFGITRHAELLVEFRLGLESEFGSTATSNNGPHDFRIAPGARFFFSEGRRSKLFTTAQAVFDFTNYTDSTGVSRGNDLGVRNLNGLWIDLDRAYGFYFFVGETATFARWIRLDLEAGVGLQARFF